MRRITGLGAALVLMASPLRALPLMGSASHAARSEHQGAMRAARAPELIALLECDLMVGAAASVPASPSVSANEGYALQWDAQPRAKSWTVPVLHSAALMTTMRATEAYLWPYPFAETDLGVIGGHYRQAFTRPPKWDSRRPWFESDGDRWQINLIGHSLLGSELYARTRLCGHDAWSSLAFTAAASAVWEYGFEASGVRPSGLDLWFTPLSGVVLGEFRYWSWHAAGNWHPVLKHSVRFVMDPLGQFERALGSPC